MRGRVVHCRREDYDIYIGRPSKWGNPYPLPSKGYDRMGDPARIFERYEEYVRSKPALMAALPELKGKVLGCWCAPKRCHGDILVRLANGPDLGHCHICGASAVTTFMGVPHCNECAP